MTYFRLVILVMMFVRSIDSASDYPKLVVVSFDGFRHDYLDKDLTPFLNSLRKEGSFGATMKSVFPSQTFPNHFSIATGLYTEIHGVLASRVYDIGGSRILTYGYSLFHYNDNILPIWAINELAGDGRHSGVMMWPGSEFDYKGISATFIQKYNLTMDWESRVDEVINWLINSSTPANLAMLYFEEPDRHGHAFGPDSNETHAQIRRADNIAKYLFEKINLEGVPDVHVVFLSDHGIEKVFKTNIIDLRPIVGDQCTMNGSSPVLQVHPNPGVDLEEVYSKLKKVSNSSDQFEVYKKGEIPEHMHYKHCLRAPPILVISKKGYIFQDMYDSMAKYKRNFNGSEENTFGEHGYDPTMTSMQAFFIATGPSFKPNYTVHSQLEVIDMFAIFCRVLELEPPPVHPNTTYDRVEEVFLGPWISLEILATIAAILIISSQIFDVLVALVVFFMTVINQLFT